MKYTKFLISSLTLYVCLCSNFVRTAILDELPDDMLRYVNPYLSYQEQDYFRNISGLTLTALTLKKKVEQIFNISGLENVADNEPELAGVLRLSWTSHDPFFAFVALMEDVLSEKRSYEVLFRPLILHLIRFMRGLDDEVKQRYKQYMKRRYRSSFEGVLANICAKKGHIDLIFEIARDNEAILRNLFKKIENKKLLIETFRNTEIYLNQYLTAVLTDTNPDANSSSIENRVGLWIAECIINNLPQHYYEQLFAVNPVVLEFLIDHLFLSTNVPESEYSRIYAQIVHLFDIYSVQLRNSPNFAALRLINDIRFGTFNLNEFQNASLNSIKDKNQRFKIAKSALLSNKKDLFSDIFAKYKFSFGSCLDGIVSFDNLNVNDIQAKNFQVIFEMIKIKHNVISEFKLSLFEFKFKLLKFVTKFYAIKHLKLDGDFVTFEFVASENLLEFGFSPNLLVKFKSIDVSSSIKVIFSYMKVFNEQTIGLFMEDFVNYLIISPETRTVPASYEFVEFISKFPSILRLMSGNGIRLAIDFSHFETLEKYFNLDNFEWTSQIIDFSKVDKSKITELKTLDHIRKMEFIKMATVGELYSHLDNLDNLINYWPPQEYYKFKYFQWRKVFAYWLVTRNGEGIQQIQSPEMIEMLKLDFPDKTKELFPPEQS